MGNNLYITGLQPQSGLALVTLGVMELLVRNLGSVAFFRPIVNTGKAGDGKDAILQLIADHYALAPSYDRMYGVSFEEARALIAEKQHDRLLEKVLDKYKELEEQHDFVLCLGTDFESDSAAFEFDLNVDMANNLGCPVLMVASAGSSKQRDVIEACRFAVGTFKRKGSEVMAVLLTRAPTAEREAVCRALGEALQGSVDLIYSVPNDDSLEQPTMAEIAAALNAVVIYGEGRMNRPVSRFVVAAMNLRNFLARLTDNSLIITPVDRIDIVLGTLAAFRSSNMPNIAGIVLTGYLEPDALLRPLLQGLNDLVPIIKVKEDTFTTAMQVRDIRSDITAEARLKIAAALNLFETNVDTTELRERIVGYSVLFITPKMFEFSLIKRARAFRQTIVLPEGEEERILKAAEILMHRQAVNIILLGREERVRAKILSLGLQLDDITVIDPVQSPHFNDYAETFFTLCQRQSEIVAGRAA